jgi:hypothetical protein
MQLEVRTPPEIKVDSRRALVYSYPELLAISYIMYLRFVCWAPDLKTILLVSCEISLLITILSFQENAYVEHVEFCAQLLAKPLSPNFYVELGNNFGLISG